jgi:hypothetical protein
MEFVPNCLSRSQSDLLVDRIEEHFWKHSFGLYALELREDQSFIGFLGLAIPAFTAHFTPCVEIGWRMSANHWGRGLATEGARAVVRYAFEELRLVALVSFTVPANIRSRSVMERIGMVHNQPKTSSIRTSLRVTWLGVMSCIACEHPGALCREHDSPSATWMCSGVLGKVTSQERRDLGSVIPVSYFSLRSLFTFCRHSSQFIIPVDLSRLRHNCD